MPGLFALQFDPSLFRGGYLPPQHRNESIYVEQQSNIYIYPLRSIPNVIQLARCEGQAIHSRR